MHEALGMMVKAIVLASILVLAGCGTRTYAPSATEVCANISNSGDQALCESQLQSATAAARERGGGTSVFAMIGLGYVTWLWYIAYYVSGLVFARFIYVDAKKREWLAFRVRPFWWAAICVFDPALGALIYWVVHYSRLVRRGHA